MTITIPLWLLWILIVISTIVALIVFFVILAFAYSIFFAEENDDFEEIDNLSCLEDHHEEPRTADGDDIWQFFDKVKDNCSNVEYRSLAGLWNCSSYRNKDDLFKFLLRCKSELRGYRLKTV